MKRDWSLAEGKRNAGCRIRDVYCAGPVELAHTIGRRYDAESGVVDPDDVVPLCRYHHGRYDMRELDLQKYTSYDEEAAATRHVGIIRAFARLTSGTGELT